MRTRVHCAPCFAVAVSAAAVAGIGKLQRVVMGYESKLVRVGDKRDRPRRPRVQPRPLSLAILPLSPQIRRSTRTRHHRRHGLPPPLWPPSSSPADTALGAPPAPSASTPTTSPRPTPLHRADRAPPSSSVTGASPTNCSPSSAPVPRRAFLLLHVSRRRPLRRRGHRRLGTRPPARTPLPTAATWRWSPRHYCCCFAAAPALLLGRCPRSSATRHDPASAPPCSAAPASAGRAPRLPWPCPPAAGRARRETDAQLCVPRPTPLTSSRALNCCCSRYLLAAVDCYAVAVEATAVAAHAPLLLLSLAATTNSWSLLLLRVAAYTAIVACG
ncbi:mucin-1 [Triticum aestivum]|uniref:mucin-1 n=1 Tax=Triticum aestivum TaxID=4565 RepID=UPI001D02E9AC|nr:mucin-1-like [Triticum aestivum]